jgi:transposase InsO family protein
MAWKEMTLENQRQEFVMLAGEPGCNRSALCARFGISRKTGYKWLNRAKEIGLLCDQSRRPHHSPRQTESEVEQRVLTLRAAHPAWGGRKLRRRLLDLGQSAPASSTITQILRRHQLLDDPAPSAPGPWRRFARALPNDLWQMDFKGHLPCRSGRCHPLTALDDCSRFALILQACADEQRATVQSALIQAFRRYGLPWEMLTDNGSPWGGDFLTRLSVWLMRLGILITHGRPSHPQTQGKEERFHRTLRAELLGQALPWDLPKCQERFDEWRHIYNTQRPHEALQMQAPVTRYRTSVRAYPETLPPVEYGSEDQVRRVQAQGWTWFAGREIRLSKALHGQPVAFRPDPLRDGFYAIYFCRQKISDIDLNHMPKERTESVTHVPKHL